MINQAPYGTLTDEYFKTLESFWNNVLKNVFVPKGSNEASSTFVLPQNFGGGLRRPDDIIWGIFINNSESQHYWDALQEQLQKYGNGLNIIYGG